MRIKPLTLSDAEYIAHRYAIEKLNFENEPMPPFDTRSPGQLESCLAEPFQSFNGKLLHSGFAEKAALLFYLVTKNHCFSNGNKRMAVTLTTVFFFINGRWLDISTIDLYELAKFVAKSDPKEKNDIVKTIKKSFKAHEIPLEDAH